MDFESYMQRVDQMELEAKLERERNGSSLFTPQQEEERSALRRTVAIATYAALQVKTVSELTDIMTQLLEVRRMALSQPHLADHASLIESQLLMMAERLKEL